MSDWQGVYETLIKNTSLTIGELKEKMTEQLGKEKVIDVIVLSFGLLQENCVCLQTRLNILLVLESIAQLHKEISPYIHEIIGDIYDESTNSIERTFCSWILVGSLESYEVMNIKEAIRSIQLTEKRNMKERYSYTNQYPEEDIDLTACIQSCQEDVDLYKFADSQFQRPSLSFIPTRNDYSFFSPLHFSPTFLYTPLSNNRSDKIARLLVTSITKPLTDEELETLHKDSKNYQHQIQMMVNSESLLTPNQFRSLITNNTAIALDIIHSALLTSRKQQVLDIISQSPFSLSILHVVSQLTILDSVPNTFFSSFVEKSAKALLIMKEDSNQIHYIQIFCYFLAGLYKNKRADEIVLRNATTKLKENFMSIPEVACVIALMSSGI